MKKHIFTGIITALMGLTMTGCNDQVPDTADEPESDTVTEQNENAVGKNTASATGVTETYIDLEEGIVITDAVSENNKSEAAETSFNEESPENIVNNENSTEEAESSNIKTAFGEEFIDLEE